MVSVYLYSLCGLACSPVSSVVHVGGEDRGHSRGRPVALPGLTTPGHGVIFSQYLLSFKIKSTRKKRPSDQNHLCHTRFSLEFLLCADGEYVPTGRPSDGSEWCVESLPPPEAAEASGGRVSPRPWLCDQSPVLPLCSGSTHPLSSSRLASVTIGHQDTEDTGPAPSHQQGNNSESSSSIIHSPPASREPEADSSAKSGPVCVCVFPFVFIPDVHFIVAREMNDIWGEVFLSIIGSVYQSVWLLVMFAPIPLSLIFIKLFWAHRQNKKWTFSNGNVYLALKENRWHSHSNEDLKSAHRNFSE